MKFLDYVYSIPKKFKKLSIWVKLIILFIILLCIIQISKDLKKKIYVETFSGQNERFIVKRENNEIYDDFYADIYDDLVLAPNKNHYEMEKLINDTKLGSNSNVLDVGSGTGHHVNMMTEKGINCEGLDISDAMIRKAQEKFASSSFKQGDVTSAMLYSDESFTHITCFYFTIYYLKNKMQFFQNCFKWLKPGGYLIVHLVNKSKFSPLLPSGDPINVLNVQHYAKKRVNKTVVKFKDFSYKSEFIKNSSNNYKFKELMKFDSDGKIRVNEHTLHMDSQSTILSLAKDAGFIMSKKIDLLYCNYDDQYLYVLQKPN
jgi:ubiquinone/menaquinone biosynthesis C-methylase UbiE